ncbi:hypothetical protein E2C01_091143 [Portunus trituberculatus]|uniref:Uncharacterized protein n=1 Tax=Portunus trituberculatus TaxID=210409 RepID=A0A5B7JU94_PORTR|nr:hypothetical protein [Portunus trituberculatus]
MNSDTEEKQVVQGEGRTRLRSCEHHHLGARVTAPLCPRSHNSLPPTLREPCYASGRVLVATCPGQGRRQN